MGGMATKTFYVSRNGAVVCGRNTLDEALDYARKCIGWDIHQGKDTYRTEFATVAVTYQVEEAEWVRAADLDDSKWVIRSKRAVPASEAIMPFGAS